MEDSGCTEPATERGAGFEDPSPCPLQGMISMLVHHWLHLAERSLYQHGAGMQSLRMMKTACPLWALLATCLLLIVRHTAASEAKAKASASAYASGGEASTSSTAEALGGGTAYAATQADVCAYKDKVTYGSPSAYKAEYGEAPHLCSMLADCCGLQLHDWCTSTLPSVLGTVLALFCKVKVLSVTAALAYRHSPMSARRCKDFCVSVLPSSLLHIAHPVHCTPLNTALEAPVLCRRVNVQGLRGWALHHCLASRQVLP